ncbi:MAG: hypothetical protein AB1941_20605 [Gemmatimonadota bacterium]
MGMMLAFAACSDTSPDPTASEARDRPDFTTLSLDPTVWDMAIVQDEYGSNYSLDDSPEGQALPPYIDSDALLGDAVVCRDHMGSAIVWWDSPNGNGLVGFPANPPLRFHNYTGYFTDRRGLRWRKAVYSTSQASEGQDNAGNVWRFQGRFNALCRMGQKQMGPIRVDAQLVFPNGPIDQPVLVRRGTGGEGCGGDLTFVYEPVYDPYDPYGPEDGCDGSSGGGDGGAGGGGDNCHVEYIYIEVFNGSSWDVWWEGNATVCE